MSPNPPHPPTRERILLYLQENRVASAQGLSRTWGLTRADIRYHLNTLMEDGLVERVPREANQTLGRGRPVQQYQLSAGHRPDNLAVLCGALLDALLGKTPLADHETALQEIAEHMTCDYLAPAGTASTSPTQRFNHTVAYLIQHRYQARWEAHANGPRILLRNCPYAAVLSAHPEMCVLDRLMIERLVKSPLQQTAVMNLITGKPPACIFTSK